MTAKKKIGMQLFAIVVLSIGIILVARNGFAWTSPSANPPLGTNVINVSNGNVGIGTANPAAKLDIISSSINSDTQIGEFAAPNSTAGVGYVTFGSGFVGWDYANAGIAVNAHSAGGSIGGIFVKRVDSGHSNVDIGMVAPAYRLDVNGDIRTAGQLYGNGSQTAYGALSVNGTKNGWSGINFQSGATNYGTLMMHPSYSGFFNAADNNWRWYVDDNGISYQPGYANVSDVYIRNAGKWASQLGGGTPSVGVYQCPMGTNGWNPGGVWASYGCMGQISSVWYCVNVEYPNVQYLPCSYLGTLRVN